ncbi:hypothetical protein Tco_0307728 [Tanacetum coccineum]
MSGKSSLLKRLIIGLNVWVKLSKEENIFTLATDSYASNPTPIDCMERVSYRRLLWRRVKTKCSQCAGEQWWVEANMVSPEVESEKWRRLLLHYMRVAFDVSTDSRKEDLFPRNERSW